MLLSRFSLDFETGERAVQIPFNRLALIASVLLAQAVSANEVIKPTLDVQDMRVVVNYVSIGDLAELQRNYGAHIDRRDVRQNLRHGFSILRTNRDTGARTCEIYLPNHRRPDKVDDTGTLTLGHELLHCMLGDYHR